MRGETLQSLKAFVVKPMGRRLHWIVYIAILALGILARTWEFGRVPPGLNPDEASIGVEAYTLLRFGVDRNGVAFPIQFIAWGAGQSVPYAYMLVPLLALLRHLSPVVVRLPMLMIGIITLPLVYLLGKWLVDRRFGLLAMFFLAVSPWHIILSRWALDANLFPFFFLAAFICLLPSPRDGRWFILGCALLGLSLYAYATAYAMVPCFLLLVLVILARTQAVRGKNLIVGLAIFGIIAAPIGLFILINSAGLNSIKLGPVTIPRFPVPPRYETHTVIGDTYRDQTLTGNLLTAGNLLLSQSDGLTQNEVEPYGYFYRFTLPFALLGIGILVSRTRSASRAWEAGLLLSWIGASIPIAVIQAVNINRFNIIFIPLIVCIALAVYWLHSWTPLAIPISVGALLIGFVAFSQAYHGAVYRAEADIEFRKGILPALTFAQGLGIGPICISGQSGQYIYALFTDPMNPSDYLTTIRYDDPQDPQRNVISLGRYTFGTRNCEGISGLTYVLWSADLPPHLGNRFDHKFFDNYVVYYARP